MGGVTFALVDFKTGGPIVDLPIEEGAGWTAQLNRADSLSCSVALRSKEARALDLRSSATPGKALMVARTDERILAWGLISARSWDEDSYSYELTATGIRSSWLGRTLVLPPGAQTSPLTALSENFIVPNPALRTFILESDGLSLADIGRRIVQQRLSWPGSPTMTLPPVEGGASERSYDFPDFKTNEEALDGLTESEGGPEFAFDAEIGPDGRTLAYSMRSGTKSKPLLGMYAGAWTLGPQSPITGLTYDDDAMSVVSAVWMAAGRNEGTVLFSRALNPQVIADGYPSYDIGDASHSDVVRQRTLDAYAVAIRNETAGMRRDISFSVRGDAAPGLGEYRVGDSIVIDVPEDHPALPPSLPVRITSISGDETGATIKIGGMLG